MDLFLIRHAIAEERRAGLNDEDRKLTETGRKRFRAMVEDLRRGSIELDRVYTSPWKRAVQTAELLDPVRFPRHVVDALKRDMGAYAWAAWVCAALSVGSMAEYIWVNRATLASLVERRPAR